MEHLQSLAASIQEVRQARRTNDTSLESSNLDLFKKLMLKNFEAFESMLWLQREPLFQQDFCTKGTYRIFPQCKCVGFSDRAIASHFLVNRNENTGKSALPLSFQQLPTLLEVLLLRYLVCNFFEISGTLSPKVQIMLCSQQASQNQPYDTYHGFPGPVLAYVEPNL